VERVEQVEGWEEKWDEGWGEEWEEEEEEEDEEEEGESEDDQEEDEEEKKEEEHRGETFPPDMCVICLTELRNTSIVHGQAGHQICCTGCAERLKKDKKKCPVWRKENQTSN